MIKLYCIAIVLALVLSLTTNQSTQPTIIQINELSNNLSAFLLMPIYIPYRIIRDVVIKLKLIFVNSITMINDISDHLYYNYIKPFFVIKLKLIFVNSITMINDICYHLY